MSTPPPFGAPTMEPRRRNNTLLIALLIGVPVVACIAFIIFGVFAGMTVYRQLGPTIGCAATYGFAEAGLQAYVKANDGKLPPAESWQDAIVPFVLKEMDGQENIPLIEFKPEGEWTCASGDQVFGIAFNTELGGQVVSEIENPSEAVILFETTERGRNLHEAYVAKDPETAPKRFGQKGWITLTADWRVHGLSDEKGNVKINVSGSSGNVSVDAQESP